MDFTGIYFLLIASARDVVEWVSILGFFISPVNAGGRGRGEGGQEICVPTVNKESASEQRASASETFLYKIPLDENP